MIYRKTGDWLAAKAGDDVLMMSAENDLYIGLSGTSARIWELLDTPCDLDTLCEHLVAAYEVDPETCRREVRTFLNDLVERNVIEVAGGDAG
ncbi:hypothetical protein B2G71_23440 [Novosphingobium sp. PC22D]|uniref:PqqD family protein n=1 Tax=Novosphingobium sp. PC22D TaxID=1962403 RepID=UPI000BF119A4|nr:PqqD family protein [Novosphingobium sp. PC22D]PEQ10230.1 hypothetical protein B2G71_23440 [Novosphingobium sp. PC22D]